MTESLYHTLDLLLKDRCATCWVNHKNDFLLHCPKRLKLKDTHLLNASIAATDSVDHPVHSRHALWINNTYHIRNSGHFFTSTSDVVQIILLTLPLEVAFTEKWLNCFIAGYFFKYFLFVTFNLLNSLFDILEPLILVIDVVLDFIEHSYWHKPQFLRFLCPQVIQFLDEELLILIVLFKIHFLCFETFNDSVYFL